MLKKGKLLAESKAHLSWDDFLVSVTKEMDQRNPSGDWEVPYSGDSESFEQTCDSKYLRDADEVFDEVQINADTKVFEMGKSGLMFDDVPILPACRTGFCRDWKHDGICSAVLDKGADKCRRSTGEPEWFPEQNKCFDLTFKIRDVGATKTRHDDRLQRLEERMIKNDVSFDDIMGSNYAEDNIEYTIVSSTAWLFRQDWDGWKRPRSQTAVRQIKSWVNGQTRKYISERLKDNAIPPSYDTAFYIKYMPQVNAVMKEVARRLI